MEPYDLVIFGEAHKLSADREPDLTIRLRNLEGRVVEATRLGAVAYIPSGRGGEVEEVEDAEEQLGLFEQKSSER